MKIKDLFAIVVILMVCFFVSFKSSHQVSVSKKTNNTAKEIYKCKEFYDKKMYEHALVCIEPFATKTNSQNAYVRLLYAIALFNDGAFSKAKSEFEFVKNAAKDVWMIESCNSHLKQIAHIENLKRHDVGHYFTDLDKVITWKNPHFLKVYILNDYGKANLIKEAFDVWDKSSYDLVNFIYVNNPNEADIVAKAVLVNEIPVDKAVGYTSYNYTTYYNVKTKEIIKQHFKRAEVLIATNYQNDYMISDKFFKSIALHEVGHALGIASHSSSIGDVMYYSTESYAMNIGKITNRDINTLKRIYGNIL